jgi:hypothetical protein
MLPSSARGRGRQRQEHSARAGGIGRTGKTMDPSSDIQRTSTVQLGMGSIGNQAKGKAKGNGHSVWVCVAFTRWSTATNFR